MTAPSRGESSSLMREVRCKDCLREVDSGKRKPEDVKFTYNEAWAQGLVDRGGSRSDRCREHRQTHRTNIHGIAVAYIDLETVGEVANRENPTGPLGGLGALPGVHVPKPGSVDLDKFCFGMNDDHILDMLEKLAGNQRVLVLKAGTGTGKSTFVPYRLLDPPQGAHLRLADLGPIVVTEPRVQATTGVAGFVGTEMSGAGGVGPGFPVGYQVSGDRNHDDACQLVYVTDGTMINWLREGRLSRIGTVIVDEAHERNTNIDFILGYLKRELPRYPHLRVIVTSATFNPSFYQEYFGGPDLVNVMEVPAVKSVGYGMPLFSNLDVPLPDEKDLAGEAGRWPEPGLPLSLENPVDIGRFVRTHWKEQLAPPLVKDEVRSADEVGWQEDVWETTEKLIPLRFRDRIPVDQWGERMPDVLADFVVTLSRGLDEAGIYGDILGFLPTSVTIESACERIEDALGRRADVFPLNSKLKKKRKDDALAARRKGDKRKIVISTNLAETSLTVEGVRFIVDGGTIAQSEWNPELAEGSIRTKRHSRAGIKQRWGRVGRKTSGWVFPLYSMGQYTELAEDTPPESTRDNLEHLVMTAKMGGIDDVVGFPWPAAFDAKTANPNASAVQAGDKFRRELARADTALRQGGAMDQEGHPTSFGRELVRFRGLESTASALAIMYADRLACIPEVVTVLAILENERLVGPSSLLLSDYEWPDEWRVEAADRHRGIAAVCDDDADLVLQICAAWERADPAIPPWELSERRRAWSRQWWVSNDVLLAAAEARREILRALSPAMKEEVKRFVEPALLRRTRGVLTRAMPSLRYDRVDTGVFLAGGRAGPQTPPDPSPEAFGTEVQLERDSLFADPPASLIALRRRTARSGDRHISGVVKVEDWAVPQDSKHCGSGGPTDAMRLIVSAAREAPADLSRDIVTALIESWPVGQRMKLSVGVHGSFAVLEEVSDIVAPFARPLTKGEWDENAAHASKRRRSEGKKRTGRSPRDEDEPDATKEDESGELDTKRPKSERIKDETEIARDQFEEAERRESEATGCGTCPQCRAGNEQECEDPQATPGQGGKVQDALQSWVDRATLGIDVSKPEILIEAEHPVGDSWYEIAGYAFGDKGKPVVRLREDWRPPGYAGNPAHHQDAEAGQPIEVVVGPMVRDHSEELRTFVRADGLGRFILREASVGARTQEKRGEIASSLYRSDQGLLRQLTENERFAATVVPARTEGCQTITLLELLHQHLGKAAGGATAEFHVADPARARAQRVPFYAGVVASGPNEHGYVRVRLLHEDTQRGIQHHFEFKPLDRAPDHGGEPHLQTDVPAVGEAVLIRLERHNADLRVGGMDLDAIDQILEEADRQLRLVGDDKLEDEPHTRATEQGDSAPLVPREEGDGLDPARVAGPDARLRSDRETPVPRGTVIALARLDPAPGWQNQVWAFWARSHHLRPPQENAVLPGTGTDPVDVRAHVKISEETPLAEKNARFDAFAASHSAGSVLEGAVVSIAAFGAFVEVAEGVQGLVHVSELAWRRLDQPSDVVSEGQVVQAKLIEVDTAKRTLNLSIKQLEPDPFDAFVAANSVGAVFSGPVRNVKDFGAFVEVAEGVQGLIHISKLAPYHVGHPSDVVSPGQAVSVRLLNIDRSKRRIGLALEAVSPTSPPKPVAPTAPTSPGYGRSSTPPHSTAPVPKRKARAEASTVIQATSSAAATLGLRPDQVSAVVVRDVKTGFLGRVKVEALVEVVEL